MDTHILLVCCYCNMNAAIKLYFPYRFDDLLNCVCGKFDGLIDANVSMFFKMSGYNNFTLQNDIDIDNMVCLAWSFQLDHIDVIIQSRITQGADDIGDATPIPLADTCNLHVLADESDIDDDQQDLLPKFCPHADKVFLSAQWVHGMTHIEQSFEGGANEFRSVLRKYAVECGFHFKFLKNDSVWITAVCMMRESKNCMWSIHARVLRADEFFYIRKWNREHSCGIAVWTAKNLRAGSELVCDVISEQVRDRSLTRSTDVVYNLKKDYGLEISYRVTWLGVKKARGEMFGAHSISFDQLRWYSNVVMVNNPGSYINIDYDEQNHRFERFFISFKACIDGFNHCRLLLFLDGPFLKGKFKGNLLAASVKDGNQGLFPLAIAIVDSENVANWFWFLQHLANVVSNDRTLTFLPDRHTGLINSIPKIFPSAHHAFCLQHLQRNLQDKMRYVNSSYRAGLLNKFRACAYTPTVTGFNASIETFIKSGRNVATSFLKDIPPQYWANAYFMGARYSEMCSNAAESFNSWILEARHLPITQMVDSIWTKIMNQMPKRRRKSAAWPGVLCPKMEARLVKAYNKGRVWIVSQSNDNVYEVHSYPSVLVDVDRRTCSCFQWQINQLPCTHAMVAIRNSGRDLYDLVESFYHASTYRLSYASSITAIPTVEKPSFQLDDFAIHPPVIKRPPGRPKKKRMLSRGEEVQLIRCGRCQRMGNHNKKTCK
ncbi:uncharacterized protein LOC114283957 [Camellia sinensis]|uniref:uncharacterized protein LOC114283957 n=1 Tax=Camellia sinensis TaxID=4442 RepID=UPI001035590D|nr:uncharacterized protein LOC114283957 [Camellia sinensis]